MRKHFLLVYFVIGSLYSMNINADGSIAVSADNQVGMSWNGATRQDARNKALSSCDDPSCIIKADFKDSCAAVAGGSGGKSWTYGYSTPGLAKSNALNNCRKAGYGDDCNIRLYACDGTAYHYIADEKKEAQREKAKEELIQLGKCVLFKSTKYLCAGAANYDSCMSIRFGNDYNLYEYACR